MSLMVAVLVVNDLFVAIVALLAVNDSYIAHGGRSSAQRTRCQS